jgi:uncharacterized membrane protein YoaK (UPF0700 family)
LLGFFLPANTLYLFILFQSFALGIQNGILKNVRHTTSRTTHMTGYLTDAGVALGAFSSRWLDVYAGMIQLISGLVYFMSGDFGRESR